MSDTPRSAGEPMTHKLRRVLVVEDYLPSQQLMAAQLPMLHCDADIASDGAAALDLWQAAPHDLVLTDINMPVMDGLALAREIRVREGAGRRTPIIGLTAAVEPSERKRCLEAGIDEVVLKPVGLKALRALVDRWLGTATVIASDPAPVTPSSSVLDLGQMYELLGESSLAQARSLFDVFARCAAEDLEALSRQTGTDGIAQQMHRQKSAARSVGAARYAQLAERLEQDSKSGRVESVSSRARELLDALAEARDAASAVLCAMPETERASLRPQADRAVGCRTMLVVDDDPVLLRQVSLMAGNLGVRDVHLAASGSEALSVIRQLGDRVDVVVCDLEMPEMDGIEVLRQIAKTAFCGGLILTSGRARELLGTVAQLAQLHGLRVLGEAEKPLSARQLAGFLAGFQGRAGSADETMSRAVRAAPQISAESIRQALRDDEFTIWLQPKVETGSLRPVGVEALARWKRPDGSFVPPDVFIRVAESEGLIDELSRVLVRRTLAAGSAILAAHGQMHLAINLSARWLDDLLLPEFLLAETTAVGLAPASITFEVTETGIMDDLATALDVLTRLRLRGFGLSIDDFGIGYSSFEQLRRIPFTELKLDRTFVSRAHSDAASRAILETSVDIARKLKLATVAEGVETGADLALVRALGCDTLQGYFVARPMPLEELFRWLSR